MHFDGRHYTYSTVLLGPQVVARSVAEPVRAAGTHSVTDGIAPGYVLQTAAAGTFTTSPLAVASSGPDRVTPDGEFRQLTAAPGSTGASAGALSICEGGSQSWIHSVQLASLCSCIWDAHGPGPHVGL